jgi:hypothetical protein
MLLVKLKYRNRVYNPILNGPVTLDLYSRQKKDTRKNRILYDYTAVGL